MLTFPKSTHRLYFFQASNSFYPVLLPIVLNGLDVLFFYASIGAPARILTGAMACGVPLVTASRGPLLELDENFPRIPLEKNQVWKDKIPWEEVSEVITDLLAHQEKRLELAAQTKQLAEHWSWNNQIEQWVQLIKRLKLKTAQGFELERMQQKLRRPLLFCRWYDKGQGTVQSQVVSWESWSYQSLEEGLAEDLLSEHTPTEVSLVLQKLLGKPNPLFP